MRAAFRIPVAVLAAACAVKLAGCEVVKPIADVTATVGEGMGVLTPGQGAAIRQVGKAAERLTPEQEYYVGRAVAATLLQSYRPLDDPALNSYLNLLGQTLAQASDKPETFGGYHFLALDSDEINAFAAPGGFILVSRGLILCCENEDMLAAVLAHEIGHVQFEHGLRSIEKGRFTKALTMLGAEAGRTFGGQELAELTDIFEGSIADITHTLVTSGYSRSYERQADENTVVILRRVGYDPHAFVAMLQEMKKRLEPGGLDFAKTHPDPDDRLVDVRQMLRNVPPQPIPPVRRERFLAHTARLRGRA